MSRDDIGSVLPALVAGAVQAVIFNPIDRALYLRVYHRRAFSHVENWRNPFQGFANAAVYRTVASGSYLFWQDHSRRHLISVVPELEQNPSVLQFLVGSLSGTANAMSLNQLQIVKFHTWSRNGGKFLATSHSMYLDGGFRIFFRGVGASVLRDVVFGISYEICRMPHVSKQYGEEIQFVWNTAAATFASVCSSPINYCRNIIYGTPASCCPLRSHQLLLFLAREVSAKTTASQKFHHLNSRLNVGCGSLRVGVGMAVGQFVFKLTTAWENRTEPTSL